MSADSAGFQIVLAGHAEFQAQRAFGRDGLRVVPVHLEVGALVEEWGEEREAADVIGAADRLKGQLPLGFLVLNAGTAKADDEVVKEVVQLVRQQIGPVAAFKLATVVKRLPSPPTSTQAWRVLGVAWLLA